MSFKLFPEQRTNDESLAQTNADIFDIASDGVYLALAILTLESDELFNVERTFSNDALLFLKRYADWRHLDIPDMYKRQIAVMNYGEDEVQAMEEAHIPMDEW